jgi:hypothetical protein
MADAMKGLAILVLLPLAALFFKIAWTLWRMPPDQRRMFDERRQKRLHDQRMIRLWRSGRIPS